MTSLCLSRLQGVPFQSHFKSFKQGFQIYRKFSDTDKVICISKAISSKIILMEHPVRYFTLLHNDLGKHYNVKNS